MSTGVQGTLWSREQFSAWPYLFQWIRVRSQSQEVTLRTLIMNVYVVTFCYLLHFTSCIAATPTLPVCRELLIYANSLAATFV